MALLMAQPLKHRQSDSAFRRQCNISTCPRAVNRVREVLDMGVTFGAVVDGPCSRTVDTAREHIYLFIVI